MKLKNIMIVVKDVEKSKQFYWDLFGLDVILDGEENVILTEGLVLQQESTWKNFLNKEISYKNNACELFFEEKNIEEFILKLEELYPDVEYVTELLNYSFGKKIVRFYDLDGNLIEVGTPVS